MEDNSVYFHKSIVFNNLFLYNENSYKNIWKIMNTVTSKQFCCLKSYMSSVPSQFVQSVVKVDIEVFTIITVTRR